MRLLIVASVALCAASMMPVSAVAAPGGLSAARIVADTQVVPVRCVWRRGVRYCSGIVVRPRRIYRPGITIRIF